MPSLPADSGNHNNNTEGDFAMSHFRAIYPVLKHLLSSLKTLVTVVSATTLVSACAVVDQMVYKTTGDVLQGFSRDHAVPYLLQTSDLAMGCAMSESLSPLLLSFGQVTTEPDQLAVILYLSAGGCAEEQAREHELQGLAAMHDLNASAAEDAMIRQKRAYGVAASRYFLGWQHFSAYYGEPDGNLCPYLYDDMDEFVYLAGLLSGLQALNAQIQSTSSAGVPTNIGPVVARAASCLDNDKWWGAPMALQAVVGSMLPGILPDGEDAFAWLGMADQLGDSSGVRLPYVFHAMAAVNAGDEDRVKTVVRSYVHSVDEYPVSDDWRFLDAMASNMMVALSDRLWMENTGHRTPLGGLGSFWDDPREPTETMSLDDLL